MKIILTLEDELEINDFYKDLFEDHDYTVLNSTTYDEAMAIVQKMQVDLLVADNVLQYSGSDKNGLETIRAVKEVSPHTKVIMISAQYPRDLENTYVEYGIDLLLKKPFDIDVLVSNTERLLGTS